MWREATIKQSTWTKKKVTFRHWQLIIFKTVAPSWRISICILTAESPCPRTWHQSRPIWINSWSRRKGLPDRKWINRRRWREAINHWTTMMINNSMCSTARAHSIYNCYQIIRIIRLFQRRLGRLVLRGIRQGRSRRLLMQLVCPGYKKT